MIDALKIFDTSETGKTCKTYKLCQRRSAFDLEIFYDYEVRSLRLVR
jgi:hypothetical protein